MLEVVLAASLGAMMLIMAFVLMGAMARSQQRQARRTDETLALATAHGALMRAFSSLVMSDEVPGREDEVERQKEEDRKKAEGDAALVYDVAADSARFALQPDRGGVRVEGRPVQVFRLALRTPPVLGGLDEAYSDEVAFSQQGLAQRGVRGRDSERSTSKSPDDSKKSRKGKKKPAPVPGSGGTAGGGDSEADVARAMEQVQAALQSKGASLPGEAGAGAEGESPIPGLEIVDETGVAPGVTGVLELLPDEPEPARTSAFNGGRSGAGRPVGTPGAWTSVGELGMALWWREQPAADAGAPPVSDEADGESGDGAGFEERQFRRARLLGGLRWAQWSVYRGRRFDPKMTANKAEFLPAYVQLKFETMMGRREDWVFEVAWSSGPEPGSALPEYTGRVGGEARQVDTKSDTTKPTGGEQQ